MTEYVFNRDDIKYYARTARKEPLNIAEIFWSVVLYILFFIVAYKCCCC